MLHGKHPLFFMLITDDITKCPNFWLSGKETYQRLVGGMAGSFPPRNNEKYLRLGSSELTRKGMSEN